MSPTLYRMKNLFSKLRSLYRVKNLFSNGDMLLLREVTWQNTKYTGWTTDGRNFDLWAPLAVCGPILKSFGLLIAHIIRFF